MKPGQSRAVERTALSYFVYDKNTPIKSLVDIMKNNGNNATTQEICLHAMLQRLPKNVNSSILSYADESNNLFLPVNGDMKCSKNLVATIAIALRIHHSHRGIQACSFRILSYIVSGTSSSSQKQAKRSLRMGIVSLAVKAFRLVQSVGFACNFLLCLSKSHPETSEFGATLILRARKINTISKLLHLLNEKRYTTQISIWSIAQILELICRLRSKKSLSNSLNISLNTENKPKSVSIQKYAIQFMFGLLSHHHPGLQIRACSCLLSITATDVKYAEIVSRGLSMSKALASSMRKYRKIPAIQEHAIASAMKISSSLFANKTSKMSVQQNKKVIEEFKQRDDIEDFHERPTQSELLEGHNTRSSSMIETKRFHEELFQDHSVVTTNQPKNKTIDVIQQKKMSKITPVYKELGTKFGTDSISNIPSVTLPVYPSDTSIGHDNSLDFSFQSTNTEKELERKLIIRLINVEREENCANRIAAVWRGRLLRRERKKQQHRVSRIQLLWRQHRSRKWSTLCSVIRIRKEAKAAEFIQRVWRGYYSRNKHYNDFVSENVKKIQRWTRKMQTPKHEFESSIQIMLKRIIKIQSYFRRWPERRAYIEYRRRSSKAIAQAKLQYIEVAEMMRRKRTF